MISVCVATHNGAQYIREQVMSILPQLGVNDEIIISDDGSTDDTLRVIESIADTRIKVFHYQCQDSSLPSAEKATLNFHNALVHCEGEFIFLADQDDVWVENKVSIIMGYLKQYPYIVSDCYVTNADLKVVSETRFVKEEKIHYNKYAALILSTPYQGSCAAFRREVLEKSLPFPQRLQSHDRWIGDVAAFFFSVKIIPEKLIYYRRHEGTTSSAFGKANHKHIKQTLFYKWIYIKGIIKIKLEEKKRIWDWNRR